MILAVVCCTEQSDLDVSRVAVVSAARDEAMLNSVLLKYFSKLHSNEFRVTMS